MGKKSFIMTKEMARKCLEENLEICRESKDHSELFSGPQDWDVCRWHKPIALIEAALEKLGEEDDL